MVRKYPQFGQPAPQTPWRFGEAGIWSSSLKWSASLQLLRHSSAIKHSSPQRCHKPLITSEMHSEHQFSKYIFIKTRAVSASYFHTARANPELNTLWNQVPSQDQETFLSAGSQHEVSRSCLARWFASLVIQYPLTTVIASCLGVTAVSPGQGLDSEIENSRFTQGWLSLQVGQNVLAEKFPCIWQCWFKPTSDYAKTINSVNKASCRSKT